MNSRPIFTMAAWIRRNGDQPNRTGLFGQNDLVEFGYINNNTLEVWTDDGLDLSPNPFPNSIQFPKIGCSVARLEKSRSPVKIWQALRI